MPQPLLEDVYKRSGIPTYTFVRPTEYQRLYVALRTKGRGLVVEGPSGIGKTTSIIKAIEELGTGSTVIKLSARKNEDRARIENLPNEKNFGTAIIDDFHRLNDQTKQAIADFMKTLADEDAENSKIVIVGINKAGDSLVSFAPDLNNRIDTIRFETNPIDKVIELITNGEGALKINLNTKEEIAREANGSFHIAQLLCYETCLAANILEAETEHNHVEISFDLVREKVFEDLGRQFYLAAREFATGPKLRREGRAPYLHILHWLAVGNEWTLDLVQAIRDNPEQRGSVGQVVDKGFLDSFLNGEHKDLFSEVLHFDNLTNTLSVEDPKFVYYIRNILWNKFARQVGYSSITFKTSYDFALSFAGSDRDVAEAIFEGLSVEELSVFYDKNEQARILAENVEDYLSPIYRTEAQFVVVLLGPEYPKRIWTKFESEQFKHRFGENSVIPIWFSYAPPSLFDETRKYGGIEYNRDKDLTEQANYIVDKLIQKIAEVRISANSEQ
ncbi:ATPase [Paenibacillus swuensis]|uniref:ATPase n=1 Tax=Paenibacillus swuensis TaxID=1178515 RepID=A0A172TFX6_9BACL|nr:TIR domain-containing protein [Paenibacillus swuensis]ANE45941.1 ATPase [Paenibacillus swuensis]